MYTSEHPATLCKTPTTGFAARLTRALNNPIVRWLRQHALALITVPLVAAVSFVALSTGSAPSIPAVSLSADPLYTAATGDKPVLVLGLSVEFPTVGAQYLDPANNTGGATTDPSYSNVTEYLGYYDAESCYTYNKAPTETAVSPQTIDDFKRFDRSGAATSRMCTGETFSGNFLNWASSSAMDMMRLSLTGGDRYIDTPTMTILQRAVLPHDGNGFPSGTAHFWNSANFPGKQLLKSGTGGVSGTTYFGAVPATMRTAASGNSAIWIVNDLNKIYFGTSQVGTTSASSTSYTLGTPPTSWIGTATSRSSTSGWSTTSPYSNGATITLSAGVWEVIYGRNSTWTSAPATGTVTCGSPSFSSPGSSSSNKCYVRADTTGQTPPTSLTSDSFFYARVQVCDRDPTTYALKDVRDYGLCKTYSDGASTPHASYKPTGAIQKYSDQLRLAAFGYLIDQVDTRVGGVLRAPIKYVGAKTYDTSGLDNTPSGGNPKMEWNQTTGQFITNPEGNASVLSSAGSYLSGVITYVNQFGRTGPVPGRYKIYDPLSELHYEALRYLQGLSPSASAISGLPGTTDLYDGFPAATTWTDPYGDGRSNTGDYSCLKSNIVMIGDKNTNERSGTGTGGSRLPTANAANNLPDIGAWSTVVQNFEKNVTSTYLDGQGASRTTGNPNGANSSVPTGLKSLVMGSAYWARTHDIRGAGWTGTGGPALQRLGLRVKTFMFDVNEFSGSTDNTTRRTSNQLFMTAKYGGFETNQASAAGNIVTGKSTAATYNTKGNPFYQDNLTTADPYVWQDTDPATTRVGEANTYFLQSDARSVLKAFDDIFARASTKARSIAGGAIQSKNLTRAGDTIYQGTFDTSDWSGDLLAIPVAVDASNVVTISASNSWTAATQLNAMATPATSRNIVVGKVGPTATPVATDFTWAAIELVLQGNLNKATPSSTSDGLGSDRLNYLRGDKSKEGSPFRKRNSLLGDIINSGVVYSGDPTTSITSSSYTDFYNAQIAVTGTGAHAARTPAVFVGANDGMLHAFNATNGNELFAYIPSWLGPKLSALTSSAYVNGHQSYVDATPVVAEAQVGTAGTSADWKTVLVGGTGGGGQGVFALDVTDPASFSASKVMWEFTHADDQDMGNVIGRPQILKLRTSAYNATTATYKWFAVVGSGVNNYVTDSAGLFSSTGNPALFLLDLNRQVGDKWTLGTNYYKISLPVDSTLSATNATGLINFRAALGTAREVTQIYMGDLHGKLWKLDFSLSTGTADWNIGKLSPFNKGTAAAPLPYPLYIAKDASGNVQPITMAPSIAFGPTPDSSYIFFGTGKFMEIADKSSSAQQSVYMLYDDNTITGADASPIYSAISGRGRLRAGTDTTSTGVISVVAFIPGRATTNTDNLTVNTTVRSGWYFDFATSGERQISNASVFGSNIVFGSLIPGSTATASCTAAAGGGNQYTIDIVSGNGNAINSGVGIMGEPLIAEVSSATAYTPTDSTGRRTKTVTSQIFQQGSAGISPGRTSAITVAAGRLSWRQINNYQDMKNAP